MMQSQSFHLTIPRAQSCNFEAIHEFSTQSITILQIPVPIAPSPSDSDTILQIVEDSHHVGALQSAFIQSCDRFCKPSRIKKSINNCKICSQSWDACHNQFWITLRLQVRKGLQVDWKDCLEIGWIAEQQRKTMTTWVNSWTQHQSTALPPNFLRGSWIAPFFLQILLEKMTNPCVKWTTILVVPGQQL